MRAVFYSRNTFVDEVLKVGGVGCKGGSVRIGELVLLE